MITPPSAGDEPEAHTWTPPDLPETAPPISADEAPADEAPADEGSIGEDPPVGGRGRTNRLAVVSLVIGLFGLAPAAVGCAFAALVQIGRRRKGGVEEKGEVLAIAGLAVSAVWLTGVAVVLTVFGGLPFASENGASGARHYPEGMVAVSTLAAGECLSGYTEEYSDPAAVRERCGTSHSGEVGAKGTLPNGPYPGVEGVRAQGIDLCKDRTAFLTKAPTAAYLDLKVALPDKDDWKHGRREVTCVLVYTGPSSLMAPLTDTLHTRTTFWPNLEPGACLKKWDAHDVKQEVVDCTESHKLQLYAKITLPSGRYPGARKIDAAAIARCVGPAMRVLTDIPKQVEMSYVRPDRESWKAGDRLVFCLVGSKHAPLRRSLVRK